MTGRRRGRSRELGGHGGDVVVEDRAVTPLALETASAVSLGVVVASLVAGGVWLGVRVAGNGRASEERAAVTVVPDAAGLRIVGRF